MRLLRYRSSLAAGLLLLGCESTGPSTPDGVVSIPDGVTLTEASIFFQDISLTFHNSGAAPAEVRYDACAFAVRGYGYDGGRRWSRLLPDSSDCHRVGGTIQVPANGTATRVIGSVLGERFSDDDFVRIIERLDLAYRTSAARFLTVVRVVEYID